jgi:hypothetical protein
VPFSSGGGSLFFLFVPVLLQEHTLRGKVGSTLGVRATTVFSSRSSHAQLIGLMCARPRGASKLKLCAAVFSHATELVTLLGLCGM